MLETQHGSSLQGNPTSCSLQGNPRNQACPDIRGGPQCGGPKERCYFCVAMLSLKHLVGLKSLTACKGKLDAGRNRRS